MSSASITTTNNNSMKRDHGNDDDSKNSNPRIRSTKNQYHLQQQKQQQQLQHVVGIVMQMMMMMTLLILIIGIGSVHSYTTTTTISKINQPLSIITKTTAASLSGRGIFGVVPRTRTSTPLFMSSNERSTSKTTKKSVQILDKIETKSEEEKIKEEMWRVVLHNDEVHTFNYVVRSLTKVIGTLDRKAAFEICVQTHGIGKATITKTWKKQAEQFCLGLQRQGLTVSISPDEDFDGGHSGGGL